MAPGADNFGTRGRRASSGLDHSYGGIAWACGRSCGVVDTGIVGMGLGYGLHSHIVLGVGPADSRTMDRVGRMVVEGLPCYIVRVRSRSTLGYYLG